MGSKALFGWWLGLLLWLTPLGVEAHPMPNSRVLLDLQPTGVAAELQLPLGELQLALGPQLDVTTQLPTLVARVGPALRAYLRTHVYPTSYEGQPWTVTVGELRVSAAEQTATGPYQELIAHLWLYPPAGASSRAFVLHYDVIMHQVVTHAALVAIRQDWDMGVLAEHPVELGVIRLNARDNSIAPLYIESAGGSWWRGFQAMVRLGLQHIAEGTDHVLFLLVLLLPAPLVARVGRWSKVGSLRYSVGRLLQLVTAFTLGHSFTLLLGALGWVHLPSQPVEALIAFSILVSAIHAWRPLFPQREKWVAAGFGLVHGLAFASTLAGLHLNAGRLGLSILGFNLGIELMQVGIIILTVPWLLLLSRTSAYSAVRVSGAGLASLAALAWLIERLSGQPNTLTILIAQAIPYAFWLLGGLVLIAALSFWRTQSHVA